jgi:DNA-binding NarL/FixJ family response regulator
MKILVVDDHTLIRDALRSVVSELDPSAAIIEATSSRETHLLANVHPDIDLVLLDLSLPDGEDFGLLQALRSRFPAVAVVVMSGTKDQATVTRALELGAQGFIPKSASRPVMVNALRLVIEGGVYIPPEALAAGVPRVDLQVAPVDRTSPEALGLTERQVAVLALMMLGKSNKAICRDLDLAEATVKNHVTAVLKALNVTNRTEAVVAVGALGLKLPAPDARRR